MLHFGNRGRLVPRRVIDTERLRGERGWAEPGSVRRGVGERRHYVPRAGSINPVLRGNRERMLNPLTEHGIGARAERHQRVEVFGIRNIFEQIDRWKYSRNELYRLLPR